MNLRERTISRDNGGRIVLLFLLFLLAIYNFWVSGFSAFAIIMIIPILVFFTIVSFRFKLFVFWILFTVNYFLFFASRHGYMPIPMSLPTEMLSLILIAIALIKNDEAEWGRVGSIMFFALCVWLVFGILELFNDSCGIGISVARWYTGFRLMMMQLLYAYLVYILFINTPERLLKVLRYWAVLSIFASIWAFKQKNIGFTAMENAWLNGVGYVTHIVNGIVRYFSVFSDAANFGINMAASATTFFIIGLSTRLYRDKAFFIIAGLICTWGMFASGTRTAIFCMAAGFMVYVFLSRNIKIAVTTIIIFGVFFFILAFTNIGQGNNMIRRMRSAFNPEDASAGVRDINKIALKRYLKDAPWGLGIGVSTADVPPFNKMRVAAGIPPDSEYVFIWVHTGRIGLTMFIITTLLMLGGACRIVFFRLKHPSLRGIGGALCCSFVAIHLGGYANQILMQFPNVLIFYGGLSLVYALPYMEKDYQKMEYQNLRQLAMRRIEKRKKKEERR